MWTSFNSFKYNLTEIKWPYFPSQGKKENKIVLIRKSEYLPNYLSLPELLSQSSTDWVTYTTAVCLIVLETKSSWSGCQQSWFWGLWGRYLFQTSLPGLDIASSFWVLHHLSSLCICVQIFSSCKYKINNIR